MEVKDNKSTKYKHSAGAYLVLMVGTSRPPAPPPIPVTARVSRLARREPGLELPSLSALDAAMTSWVLKTRIFFATLHCMCLLFGRTAFLLDAFCCVLDDHLKDRCVYYCTLDFN